jgi:hypothetical protein
VTASLVAAYTDRYVERGRCPADDRLDAWAATGACFLPEELRELPASLPLP